MGWHSRRGGRASHHRADWPRHELVLPVAVLLALGVRARGRGQHQFEDALAHLLDRGRAVHDLAAVDVHVFFLPLPQRRVGRQLERRRGRAAIGRAAPRREADQVRAARHLARGAHGVVARRVHVDEAVRGDGLGVLVHGFEVAGAALGDRAQRLLEDGGESARLVARRGVVVHLALVDLGVVLPPLDAVHELLAHLALHRAAREQVLGAVDLGRLAEDGRAAMRHQQVDRRAQRRVRADARVAVGAAALQPDGDVRRAARFALHRVGARQHLVDERHALLDRLARAARVLDVEGAEVLPFGQVSGREPSVDLVGFAAQPHHQHAREVRVRGVARERALQDLHAHV
eukprot:Opistho-1_new@6175